MQLKTILNQVEKQKGFVYCEARWSKKREIEFVLLPRKGSKPICSVCGVVVERVPWGCGKNTQTKSYRVFLATWAKRISWKEVATVFGTSWDSVYRAIHWVVCYGIVHLLTHSRWCLLKRPENLTSKQTVKLRELLKYNLKSMKAYLMRANQSQIEPMQKMAATLLKHEPLLLIGSNPRGYPQGLWRASTTRRN